MAHDAKMAMTTTPMIMVWASVSVEAADVDEVDDVEGCDGVDGFHVHEASDEESEEVAVLSGSFEGFVELFVGGLEEGAVDLSSGAGFFDDEDEWECEEDEESGGW